MEFTQQMLLSSSLKTVQRARSINELSLAVSDVRDRYGFTHLVFLLVKPANQPNIKPLFFTTYPEEWTSLYLRKNYLEIDPVIQFAQTGFLPYDWSGLDRTSEKPRAFFKEANTFGVGVNGLTVPIRGPGGERSLFSATSDLPGKEWRTLRTSSKNDILVLSHFLHEKVLTVSGLRKSIAYRTLSKREQQCLQLLACGIVPKRIASQLQLSESAVRLYLRSGRSKLNARTMYQAIAKASFLEIIQTR
ncbi:helix-turn-helix transcriptional regulator [Agrobacterium vitis]|uniref:helix-turn-helix transcriptional regulator n=1 Tax=Agrobacterium vitis TaxID=373 RepID=UPI0015747856|nr:LuxR family transcriptional regulator [Agrobacterium vitis]NSZ19881.1 LuxR family transcriptional regulator [Agrobacterium vitis]QZO07215.1 LuxR family transcriptional regulator [Agrobacterium vitis]UJL91120.1 LuxR family transcriptional regulator [Agrobacterium vitis]